ncbi:hypothetical protein MMC30_002697 [Trapelia coarctata]|nr:hypothetical protein [Trapelia coarctata]
MDDSEMVQFQQEDAYSKSQLDAFVELYHELNTKYQDQSTVFWDTWWAVLEEYIPSVNWAKGSRTRHVQIDNELLPIEQHELCSKIDQIRERVTASIAACSES